MATETKIYKRPSRRSVMGRSDKLERKVEVSTDKIESLYTKMTLKDKEKEKSLEEKAKKVIENSSLKLRIYRELKHIGAILKSTAFYPLHYSEIETWITSNGKVKQRITRYKESLDIVSS